MDVADSISSPRLPIPVGVKEHTRTQTAAALGGALFLLFWPFVLGRRVPLLGWADLGFHELGHLVATPFGTVVHFLAGSTTQVLVPVGLGVYFWFSQRDRLAAALMLAWAASSFQDVSVYIADAPHKRLPLIGGHHDWAFLLGRWRLIDHAGGIASMVWFIGLVAGVSGLWIMLEPVVGRVRTARGRHRRAARFATAPVREPRNPPPVGGQPGV